MNIWDILHIKRTNDKKTIKKAYRERLKLTNPEEYPEEFMELRKAYEKALEYVEDEYYDEYDVEDEYEYDDDLEYEDYEIELSPEEQEFENWRNRVMEVYNDYEKSLDISYWKRLLYDDLPCQIKYYQRCKNTIYYNMINQVSNTFLPDNVRRLLDTFFAYAGNEVERAKNDRTEQSRWLNKRIKLNENIEFEKLIVTEQTKREDIDSFFAEYSELLKLLPNWENEEHAIHRLAHLQVLYEHTSISYLPYECLYVALQMKEAKETVTKEAIESLEKQYGNAVEVRLLETEYCLYKKEIEAARELLKQLYMEIPEKSYPFVYQMAICCKNSGMYYEAYQLVKYLTWLRPESFLFEMADEICNSIEEKFTTNKQVSDEEKVCMCRVYLRSNREPEAAHIIKTVKSINNWEYNMARCLCYFNEDDIEKEITWYEFLKQYPKEKLNIIQRLEWEELQARYLYEQREYKKSIEKCNELLQEYPIAYPILLLRSYVDYSLSQYNESMQRIKTVGCSKDYRDLDYLISLKSDRVEARLLSASIMQKPEFYDNVQEELEVIKEKRPEEYEWYKIVSLDEKQQYDEAKQLCREFFTKAMNSQLKMPAVSKYYLLDIKMLFEVAVKYVRMFFWEKEQWETERQEYFNLLEGLQYSEYNNPEKYIDFIRLYNNREEWEKAEKLALEELNKAKNALEIRKAVEPLFNLYADWKNVEHAEKVYEKLQTDEDKRAYSESMGRLYLNTKNYEKAIEMFEFAKKFNCLGTASYGWLANSYANINEFEKASQIRLEGILRTNKSGDFDNKYNLYYDNYAMYMKQKEWDEALKYLKLSYCNSKLEGIRNRFVSEYVRTYNNMLDSYVLKADYEYVEMMCKNVPKEVRPYLNSTIGLTYDNYQFEAEEGEDYSEQLKKAKLYFHKDLKDGNRYIWVYGRLGNLYYLDGDYEKAIDILEKGIEKSNEYENYSCDYFGKYNLYAQLVDIYKVQEKWEKVVEYIDLTMEYCQLENVKEDTYNAIAIAYFYTEQYDKAYDIFYEEIEYSKLAISMTCFAMGKYKEAEERYRNCFDDYRDFTVSFLRRIAHCEFMENRDKNKEKFESLLEEIKALEGESFCDREDVLWSSAELYLLSGNRVLAEQYKEQALKYQLEKDIQKSRYNEEYYIWSCIYDKKYKEGYRYMVEETDDTTDGERCGLRYFLKNKASEE